MDSALETYKQYFHNKALSPTTPEDMAKYIDNVCSVIQQHTSTKEEFLSVLKRHIQSLETQTRGDNAFETGIPAGAAIQGIGHYTRGFVLQIRQAHAPESESLSGHYKKLSGDAETLVRHYMPVKGAVANHMADILSRTSQMKFEHVRNAILKLIGTEQNAHLLNTHLFHPKEWAVVHP